MRVSTWLIFSHRSHTLTKGEEPMKSVAKGARWGRRRVAVLAAAAAMMVGALLALPPASAATTPGTTPQIPVKDRVTSTVVVKGTPQRISTATYLARARAAGVSAAQLTQLAAHPDSYSCWYWNTEVDGHNVFGNTVWSFHVQPNWCTTGYWLASPVYTNTWAHTWPGWSYTHTGGWTRYGAGWNIYITHQNAHFCLASYFGCVDNSYPWIEDEVGPGSRTDYFHWGG